MIDESKFCYHACAMFVTSNFDTIYIDMFVAYNKPVSDSKEAILSYKRVLSLNPENRGMYKKLIKLYREDNRLDELCDEWQSIYVSQPDNIILEEFLITALHKAGRKVEATKIINKSENE